MAADTGPIGGNLSHEFVILAETGESKIFTDKRIFDVNGDQTKLEKNNIDTIIDDTDENFSSKIKKMNLIGAPYQIIIGKQTDGDLFEFNEIGGESQKLKIEEIASIIIKAKLN